MREKLKTVFRYIIIKEYSEDTTTTIMYLLAKTTTPEDTINSIIKILEQDYNDEETYQALTKLL